jgi:hypothetical protein
MTAQPPLFTTICADCGGTGYKPDPAKPEGSGWVIPCDCNPGGRAHYDPERSHIPY